MSKNVPLLLVLAGILITLIVLFLCFGHLKHEREEDWPGSLGMMNKLGASGSKRMSIELQTGTSSSASWQ